MTNTVLYQYGNFNPSVQARRGTTTSTLKTSLRRSISVPTMAMEEFQAIAKPILPTYYSKVKLCKLLQEQKSESRCYSSSLTAAWILLRITGNRLFTIDIPQKIPSWTGFRKLVTLNISTQTTIGNCRSFPASPTDINVVYTMLINVKKILTNIG